LRKSCIVGCCRFTITWNLLCTHRSGSAFEELDGDRHERRKGKKGGGDRRDKQQKQNGTLRPMEDLVKHGKLSLEAITYMRGDQFHISIFS